MATEEELEIAWAAGLFEGEGCFYSGETDLRAQMGLSDLDVLNRFDEIVGVGVIYGPYQYQYKDGFKRKRRWVWMATADDARVVFELLRPWLGKRRLARGREIFGERVHSM
jgi:hypothetical protein